MTTRWGIWRPHPDHKSGCQGRKALGRWKASNLWRYPTAHLCWVGNVIRTPSGDSIRIDVKPGTQIGDRRRIPKMSFGDEDLDVEFVLEDNTKLTDAQIVALERLRDTGL